MNLETIYAQIKNGHTIFTGEPVVLKEVKEQLLESLNLTSTVTYKRNGTLPCLVIATLINTPPIDIIYDPKEYDLQIAPLNV